MYRFRGRISREILKVKLPPLVLYLILSVPLIILEEQIDCMPSWCGTVAIPPTLPFLFIEMLVLGGIVLWRHAKNALRITLVFSIYGVLFEIFLGGLVGSPLVIIALIGPYVAVGYAFISILPLTVLLKKEETLEDRKEIAGTGRVAELQTQDSNRIHWPRRDLIASGIRC